ncbi:MAG TPA: hypothetical protein VND65_01130, partial [Candidatus Binatia bacterium]|nr:hypothetical protein [Candidatus Binatia bacterium]
TYGYDFSRDNVNANESILKASTLTTLSATNSPDLNEVVYAEPLYVSQLVIGSSTYDVLFVATEENWVYALNADSLSSQPLWSANLNCTTPPTCTNPNDEAVPDSLLPGQCNNIGPEVGITGTPVIDTAHNVMYVVSKHYNTSTHAFTQRLNMLYITSGQPVVTTVDIGQALGTSNFSALNQQNRGQTGRSQFPRYATKAKPFCPPSPAIFFFLGRPILAAARTRIVPCSNTFTNSAEPNGRPV